MTVDLNLVSENEGQPLNEAERVIATIAGDKEEVLVFLEGAFMLQTLGGEIDVKEVKLDGEELEVVNANSSERQ